MTSFEVAIICPDCRRRWFQGTMPSRTFLHEIFGASGLLKRILNRKIGITRAQILGVEIESIVRQCHSGLLEVSDSMAMPILGI